MPDYKAPLKDMQFVLHEVFNAEQLWREFPALQEVNRELADAILEESAKINEGLIAPLSQSGDAQGVRWQDGNVITPEGYKEAFKQLAEGGWAGLSGEEQYGAQNMPKMLILLFEEMLYSANIAMGLYLTLTSGAALAIANHASDELKEKYLPNMYAGKWAGAMCLTEAHAGTDLGMIRTKAIPQADGSYAISGTKIFITGGEQDLTENIIHLVLAKLPDAPAGSKGISLFLVPKVKVNDDGSLGDANGVNCGSVEHKMGIHASATCVLNFDGAQGFLVGEINKGLQGMFTMMNYERLSVGIQGLSAGQAAYQWSAEYALERLQSRAPSGPQNADGAADPLIVHPDVRRMMLTQKAYVEAGRAFAVYVGKQLDTAKFGEGEAQAKASALVELLTPVAKAFLTDKGLEGTVLGQQVFGGHGYVKEWGMEQLVRDVRISQIYEGTNGIQALDLMGRKIAANGGKYLAPLLAEMRGFVEENGSVAGLAEFLTPLSGAIDNLEALTETVLSRTADGDANAVGAASVEYLHVMGLTLYTYMWALQCKVILSGDSAQSEAFNQAKLHTARFFVEHLLPQADALSASIRNGSDSLMAIPAEAFLSA
ncbi:acyl-CoA dehydrogenase C-terminal domain-containing protein [Spongiibacter taiwanensis]|uniref:acyl-CoA dehydrogenase C-terminal domain-containing protein n=1 Tax=Spongiibacter taiwanensis TaxID=1748242 RepID=UPI00203608DC|nr:acyl-CoA dehydrogenase C-terminal domain-containing protein [Spongiibacter taiwanensis]USA42524.1 acyl-CoA dehydrogenase C-terminal domain-containing protein [Spongiibacter taiwanensis]